MQEIIKEFRRIFKAEINLFDEHKSLRPDPETNVFLHSETDILHLTEQILEFAKSSTVPRSYIERYNLDQQPIALESVGAHTNLASVLADRALAYTYGSNFGGGGSWTRTIDDYSYREVMEAIRIHDLPENEFGDWPDNGSTDKEKKSKLERDYMDYFATRYPAFDTAFGKRAIELFFAMGDPNRITGSMLYLADKLSANIIALQYDRLKKSPVMHLRDERASSRDYTAMNLCDWTERGYYKASEMWTIDYLHIRKLYNHDINGFFTAVLIMATLIVNGKWYTWREKDYI